MAVVVLCNQPKWTAMLFGNDISSILRWRRLKPGGKWCGPLSFVNRQGGMPCASCELHALPQPPGFSPCWSLWFPRTPKKEVRAAVRRTRAGAPTAEAAVPAVTTLTAPATIAAARAAATIVAAARQADRVVLAAAETAPDMTGSMTTSMTTAAVAQADRIARTAPVKVPTAAGAMVATIPTTGSKSPSRELSSGSARVHGGRTRSAGQFSMCRACP